MPPDRPTAAALLLALVLCALVVASVAGAPGIAGGESPTVNAPQDPAAGEATLALNRPTRRLIQQGLRNEGFDPGTPDGLFGPRTRAAIRDWQQSRGASPTGYLNGVETELLRTAAVPRPAVAEGSPPLQTAPAVEPDALSTAAPPASTAEADANPAAPVATEAAPQNAAATNTQPTSGSAPGSGSAQLPPDIMVDRHLLRAERLPADDDPTAALQAMNEILALHEEHDVVLAHDFDLHYAQEAFAAGRTQNAITALNDYLVAAGREGEFYREALKLLDAAEVRLERRPAERECQRAEAQRPRTARWSPGHLFGDCETCPEMVVLPGSAVAPDVRVGDQRRGPAAAVPTSSAMETMATPLAQPGFSADGSPSRDVRELERGTGVCGLADPDNGDRLTSTQVRDIGGSSGKFSAWVQLLPNEGAVPVGNHRRNRLGLSDPARKRGRVEVALLHGGLWAPLRVHRSPRLENTGVA